jgi:hypothetical protein
MMGRRGACWGLHSSFALVRCSTPNPKTHPAAQAPTVSTYGSTLTLSYMPYPPASSPACSRRGHMHIYSREVAALCASRPLSPTIAPHKATTLPLPTIAATRVDIGRRLGHYLSEIKFQTHRPFTIHSSSPKP